MKKIKITLLIFATILGFTSCEETEGLTLDEIIENELSLNNPEDIEENGNTEETESVESTETEEETEEEIEITNSTILGEWDMTSYESLDGSTTTTYLGQSTTTNYSTIGSNFDYQLVITENPNIMSGSGSYTGTIYYEDGTSQSALINTDGYSDDFLGGPWSLEGDILTLTTAQGTTEMEVLLTENTLTLIAQLYEERTESYGGYDLTNIATGEVIMTFDKIN